MSVIDSGPGIPGELHERVFEPFFSSHGDGRPGLGLSIAQGIVEEHGGSLELIDTDEGTHLRVRLPISEIDEKGHDTPQSIAS